MRRITSHPETLWDKSVWEKYLDNNSVEGMNHCSHRRHHRRPKQEDCLSWRGRNKSLTTQDKEEKTQEEVMEDEQGFQERRKHHLMTKTRTQRIHFMEEWTVFFSVTERQESDLLPCLCLSLSLTSLPFESLLLSLSYHLYLSHRHRHHLFFPFFSCHRLMTYFFTSSSMTTTTTA